MYMGDVELEGETCKPHCTETYYEVRIHIEKLDHGKNKVSGYVAFSQ